MFRPMGWAGAVICCASSAVNIRPRLIRGTVVDPLEWKQVVLVLSSTDDPSLKNKCTATVVGTRAILTAAHCASTGSTAEFAIDGKTFQAKLTRHPKYAQSDEYDLALGVVDEDLPVTPFSIGGVPRKNDEVLLLGYGCTSPKKGGGNDDDKLRSGKSIITQVHAIHFQASSPTGSLLCPGDSGGPSFYQDGSKLQVVGINVAVSGDPETNTLLPPNFITRTDVPQMRSFMKDFAQRNSVQICGVTTDCGIPTPWEPSCTLTAVPGTISLGDSLSLNLTSKNAVSAEIEGISVAVPNGQLAVFTPQFSGARSAQATVKGKNGEPADCRADFTVTPKTDSQTLSCVLTAIPNTLKVEDTVTLELSAQGGPKAATIDGKSVSVPSGKLSKSVKQRGDFSSEGSVTDAKGTSAKCYADYHVDPRVVPVIPPSLPAYALVATHCGADKNAVSTGIKKICLSTIKKDPTMTHTGFTDSITVQYSDGTQEVLPVIARRPVAGITARDEVGLFANALISGTDGLTLDMRLATLTKASDGSPSAIEGQTTSKKNFKATLSPQ